MLKKIQFKLTKIKYSGKSIGDDIRVNIEILDKALRIDKRIKARKGDFLSVGVLEVVD